MFLNIDVQRLLDLVENLYVKLSWNFYYVVMIVFFFLMYQTLKDIGFSCLVTLFMYIDLIPSVYMEMLITCLPVCVMRYMMVLLRLLFSM
jgi:hypothetical protein